MASCTKVFMTRVRFKTRNAGRKRKNHLDNHGTTPSQAAFFGDTSEGQAEPHSKPSAAKASA